MAEKIILLILIDIESWAKIKKYILDGGHAKNGGKYYTFNIDRYWELS